DEDAAPPDTWDSYTPLDRPGARAPHFWLAHRRAPYDEFGNGFTLIDSGAAQGAAALQAAAQARALPLKILRLEAPDGLYHRKLTPIRPHPDHPLHRGAGA